MKRRGIARIAAGCGIWFALSAQAETLATPDSVEAFHEAEGGKSPAFEVGLDLSSRQVTYGLADNRDPIVTFEALVEWHGFTFEMGAIFDTTHWGCTHGGYGNRKGKYQEFAFGPGYKYAFAPDEFDWLSTTIEVAANYIYEYHPRVNRSKGEENPDTQFINVGAMLPDLWLSPALSAEFDIDNERGAIYLAAEIEHTFTLVTAAGARETDPLSFSVGVGVGFGNPKRNNYDAEFDSYAFKDIWVSTTLDWQITDHVTLSPYVAVYEQLHRQLRDAARTSIDDETHASALVVGGLRLVASF